MIKAALYLGLAAIGIVGTFINPFIGVIACIEAYLINPSMVDMNDGMFRYQFWTSIALLVSFLIYRPAGVPRVGREGWLMWCVWAYIAVAAASSWWAVISATIATDAIYEVFKTVVMVTIFVRVIQSEKQMRIVMIACIVGATHASFLHVFGTRWGYVNAAFGRGEGVLPDPQNGVLLLFLPVTILVAMLGDRVEKIIAWCALPLILDSIVGTYERTGFTGLLIEFGMVFLCAPKKQKLQLLPVIVAGMGLLVFRFTPPDYWERMGTIAHPHEEASADSRFVINEASWRMFKDHPAGVGYRNYPMTSPRYLAAGYLTTASDGELVRSAHNSYFTVLCETGIEGFALWMGAFGGTVLLLRRIRKRDKGAMGRIEIYAAGLEIGVYGWAVGGWVQSYHEVDPAYWVIGLAVVLFRLQHQQQEALAADTVGSRDEDSPATLADEAGESLSSNIGA